MTKYLIEVQRTVTTEVEVNAKNPAAAARKVERADFPLPPQSEWETLKGEEIIVRDKDGNELETVST